MGRLVGALVGGILGYAAGYSLLVDELGRLGHRLFWNMLLKGKLDGGNIERVLQSETFWQVAVPALIGLFLGELVGSRLSRVPQPQSKQPKD